MQGLLRYEGSLSSIIILHLILLKATTEVAVAGLRRAPPGILEGFTTQAELVNSFRLGSEENGVYTTMQLNISGAQERGQSKWDKHKLYTTFLLTYMIDGVIAELGINGKPHFDSFDSPASLTSHTGISDLPTGYDNGSMFLLFVRAFSRVDRHRSLKFSGLNFHAGSTASPPEGQSVDNSSNRAATVHYRQGIADNGQARYPLAALPDNSGSIFTTYEMRFPE